MAASSDEVDLVRQLVLGEELYTKCKTGGKIPEDDLKKRLNTLISGDAGNLGKFSCTVKDMANLCDLKFTVTSDMCEFSSLNILKQTAELFTKKKFILGNGLSNAELEGIKKATTLKEALKAMVGYLKNNFNNMDVLIHKEKGILYLLIKENDADVWIEFFQTLRDVLIEDARANNSRSERREAVEGAKNNAFEFLSNIIHYQIDHSVGDPKNIEELQEFLQAEEDEYAQFKYMR